MISYLTTKHGGNVHEKGIVTLTSKSVGKESVQTVADFREGGLPFKSENEPGQWICWDFHEIRVHPTHYTIHGNYLKSWILEGSVNGEAWTPLDEKRSSQDLNARDSASFAVANSRYCRFIRLTQTGKRHNGDDCLTLRNVEFFGTLHE
jgi:hypothetical protein